MCECGPTTTYSVGVRCWSMLAIMMTREGLKWVAWDVKSWRNFWVTVKHLADETPMKSVTSVLPIAKKARSVDKNTVSGLGGESLGRAYRGSHQGYHDPNRFPRYCYNKP